jgi:hypothetical protein
MPNRPRVSSTLSCPGDWENRAVRCRAMTGTEQIEAQKRPFLAVHDPFHSCSNFFYPKIGILPYVG